MFVPGSAPKSAESGPHGELEDEERSRVARRPAGQVPGREQPIDEALPVSVVDLESAVAGLRDQQIAEQAAGEAGLVRMAVERHRPPRPAQGGYQTARQERALARPRRGVEAEDRHRLVQQLPQLGELALAPRQQVRVGIRQEQRVGPLRQLRRRPSAEQQSAVAVWLVRPAPGRQTLPIAFQPPLHRGPEAGHRRLRAGLDRLVVEEHRQAVELAAEVAHQGSGLGVVVPELLRPTVAGHQHQHRLGAVEGAQDLPLGVGAQPVAAELGSRHPALPPADDRHQRVCGVDLAGARLDPAVDLRRLRHHRLEAQLERHLPGHRSVGREIVGGGGDEDPQALALGERTVLLSRNGTSSARRPPRLDLPLERLQLGAQSVGRRIPPLWILLQAALHDPPQVSGKVLSLLVDRPRDVSEYGGDHLGRGLALERPPAGAHLIEHDPEGEDVGASDRPACPAPARGTCRAPCPR